MHRSPSVVVKRAQANRRKDILDCRFSPPGSPVHSYCLDLLQHGIELCVYAALLGVSVHTFNKGLTLLEAGRAEMAISASSWALLTMASCLPLRILLVLPARRALELALLETLAIFACATLAVIGYGYFIATGTHNSSAHLDMERLRPPFAACEFGAAIVLAASAVIYTLHFRTIGGLYAPICPSTHSPTIIPTFLIQVAWTVLLAISYGFALHPERQEFEDTGAVLKIVGFALAALGAWGDLCITRVARKNGIKREKRQQKRSTRQPDDAPYKRPSQTPTTHI